MVFETKKYTVLVVSSSEKMDESFRKLLPSSRYSLVTYTSSIAAAKRAVIDTFYDFVLINSPLTDDFGATFATELCQKKSSVCLFLVRNELYEKINYQLTPYGVFTVAKPTSSANMEQALRWLAAARERLIHADQKTDSIEAKMNEIRIVNRAKWLLIENMQLTEAEAHRFIEKQAMDHCVSKRSIAEDILKTYQE